ncbi:MAG: ABC transporter permease [Candidatus Aerophobetes bacterium]|nr:ABC transporter permease [Candidatus Aerophobetes bacterium]
MSRVKVVFWKELADYFGSRRFLILFIIICITGASITYIASQTISQGQTSLSVGFIFLRLFTSSAGALPSFTFFISFFGPLIGVILGFDAINSEHSRGTMSLVLSQPLFRDSLINGKFLAGLGTVAIMLISIIIVISGLGLYTLGIIPNLAEISRIGIFFIASVVYIGFWLSLGILFSILFRRTASSALASITVWIFFTFFIYMVASVIADQLVPVTHTATAEMITNNEYLKKLIMRISPATLFEEIAVAVLNPSVRVFGFLLPAQAKGLIPSPLPLSQSIMVVWPQLVGLIALMLICFAISYVIFMRQEIRAT